MNDLTKNCMNWESGGKKELCSFGSCFSVSLLRLVKYSSFNFLRRHLDIYCWFAPFNIPILHYWWVRFLFLVPPLYSVFLTLLGPPPIWTELISETAHPYYRMYFDLVDSKSFDFHVNHSVTFVRILMVLSSSLGNQETVLIEEICRLVISL